MQPRVTILIPHYKTLPLTTLCLQLLHQYTDLALAKIIVIENGSHDESLAALQAFPWITVIARAGEAGESPVESHARALDLGLAQVTTPYVLSIHTDSLVKHADWLTFLLSIIESDDRIAGVGSWKLEAKSWVARLFKKMEWLIQPKRAFAAKPTHYLRSHCALYRTDLLRQFHLQFSGGEAVAGKFIHEQLVRRGYKMIFLPSERLLKYMVHLNHATTVLNPHLSRRSRMDKDLARFRKRLRGIGKAKSIEMPF